VTAVVRWGVAGPGGIAARFAEAMRAATDGWIDLPPFMHCPDAVLVSGAAGTERIDASFEGDGLRFQIEEVHRCVAAGLTESAVMPLDETVAVMDTFDAICAQVGVVFPGEGDAAPVAEQA
jgi:hypothetical protein